MSARAESWSSRIRAAAAASRSEREDSRRSRDARDSWVLASRVLSLESMAWERSERDFFSAEK